MRCEMSTSEENESVDEDPGICASKSKKKKAQMVHFSKGRIGSFQVAAAYASTSVKNITPKNISWHESEWPELPKSSSSSPQVNSALKDKSQHGNSQFVCSSKKDNIKPNKSGLPSKLGDNQHFPDKPIQKCNMEAIQAVQNHFTCTSKEVEDLTSGLTALKVSTKSKQITTPKNLENVLSQQSCLEKRPSPNRRNVKKLKTTSTENQFHSKVKQELFLTGGIDKKSFLLQRQSLLCEDDFPDLLAKKIKKKGKVKLLLPAEDLTARKSTKKYPRRNDPISINLGEVLKLSSSSQDSKNVLSSRYLRHIWPGKTRTDTSRRVIKRGKQREFPKRKNLTKLKAAILRGRQQKIKFHLHNAGNTFNESASSPEYSKFPESVPASEEVKDSQILPREETLIDLKYLFGYSSSDVNPPLYQSESGLRETCGRQEFAFSPPLSQEKYYSNETMQLAKSSLHTRKFREYCNNDRSANLQEKVKSFVAQVYRFQTKSHFRDAEKARIHRRYVLGLREAEKYLKLRKLKAIIIATDLEANSEQGGLDEIIDSMKRRCSLEHIPIIFALKRRDLAYCVFRKVPVSCMAVLNYEGAEDLFRVMIDAWKEAAVIYDKQLKEKHQAILFAKQDFEGKASSATPTENIEVEFSNEAREDLVEGVKTIDEHESDL